MAVNDEDLLLRLLELEYEARHTLKRLHPRGAVVADEIRRCRAEVERLLRLPLEDLPTGG